MKLLLETIEHFKDKPFQWGTADCCSLAAFYIEKVTGNNLREAYGNYTTQMGAQRAQEKHGSFEDLLDSQLQPIDANFLQIGDIALFDRGFQMSPGLALKMNMGMVGMTSDGCRFIDYPIIRGWRVR